MGSAENTVDSPKQGQGCFRQKCVAPWRGRTADLLMAMLSWELRSQTRYPLRQWCSLSPGNKLINWNYTNLNAISTNQFRAVLGQCYVNCAIVTDMQVYKVEMITFGKLIRRLEKKTNVAFPLHFATFPVVFFRKKCSAFPDDVHLGTSETVHVERGS